VQVQTQIPQITSGREAGFNFQHGSDAFGGDLHWTSNFNLMWKQAIKSNDLPNATDSNKTALAPPGFNSLNGPFFDRSASGLYPSFLIGSSKAVNYLVPVAGGVRQSRRPLRPRRARSWAPTTTSLSGLRGARNQAHQWFNALDYKLNDSVTLFGELSLYRAESVQKRPAVAYGINTDQHLVVPANNPWNPYGTIFMILRERRPRAGLPGWWVRRRRYDQCDALHRRWAGRHRGQLGFCPRS